MNKQRDIFAVIIIIVLSIFASHPLWSPGMFYTHDGEIHTIRMAHFTSSLTDGHFPVRLTGNKFFGLGYPLFNFTYVAPYYSASLVKIITGMQYQYIFKLFLALSIIASGIFCYIFLRFHFTSLSSLIGASIYIFTPYRFANLYMRGALGECLFFVLIPLMFLIPHLILRNKNIYLLSTIVIIFLSITTHPLLFFAFIIPLIIYSILVLKYNGNNILKFLRAIFLGALLSSFYLIPLIFDKQYTIIDQSYSEIWREHLLSIPTILHLPLAGTDLSTPFQAGLIGVGILILTILYFLGTIVLGKKVNIFAVYFFLLGLSGLFLSSVNSRLIWENISILSYIVFPWRFIAFIILSVSFLCAFLIDRLKGNLKTTIAVVLLFLTIYSCRNFIRKQGDNIIRSDSYYINYNEADWDDQYYLPNTAKNIDDFLERQIEIIEGSVNTYSYTKITHKLILNVDNKSAAVFRLPLIYFPGWKAYIDKQPTDIDYNSQGLITLNVPQGTHQVILIFEDTPLRRIANFLSISALFIILAQFLLTGKKKRRSLNV